MSSDIADLEFGPTLPDVSQMTPGRFPPMFMQSYRLLWVVMSKKKAELIDIVAQMDEEMYQEVLRMLKVIEDNGKADVEMAQTACARLMSASAMRERQ